MCKKRHNAIKLNIINGLFALLAFNYAQAAPMLNSANGHYYSEFPRKLGNSGVQNL